MNKPLLGLWLVLPLGAWAYHEGPGQDQMTLDQVDRLVGQADAAVVLEDWETAVTRYDEALAELPEGHGATARRLRLERDKARMLNAQLPAAHADLQSLVREMQDDSAADQGVLDEARAALASSQYYLTWLMRLEGLPEEKWQPEIESARQTYRLLAERAEQQGEPKVAAQHKEDLESTIRLARMELTDLQGLPLPSQ